MILIKEKSKDKKYEYFINILIKKMRNKLIIYFIFVFLLGFFFLYYISSFCAVYLYSQIFWIIGCLQSSAIDYVINFIECLLSSLLRYVAIKKKIKCLYIVSKILG